MKITVQVKLMPTPSQALALQATLHACNAAAQHVSTVAAQRQVFTRNDLQRLVYEETKAAFGLSAQPTVRVIKKVVDAYSTRQRGASKAADTPIRFRPDGAQPFDDRCLSWQYDAQTVSIWTSAGRLRGIPYVGENRQLALLAATRKGETDLVVRKGTWFLLATCEVAEAPLNDAPTDWIGVDRGIANLATTSDGTNYSGRGLDRYRRWQLRKRAELQAKRSRSAKRRLARRGRREQRHNKHVNHRIAKDIVAEAQRTGRGIALEALGGIRDRGRLQAPQRAMIGSWPFHQLAGYIAYKAKRAGVPCFEVDAAYTSRSGVPDAVTPRGTTGPLGTDSSVVGAVSLDLPTSSPGSTCATAHARRGCLPTRPYRTGTRCRSARCAPSPPLGPGQPGARPAGCAAGRTRCAPGEPASAQARYADGAMGLGAVSCPCSDSGPGPGSGSGSGSGSVKSPASVRRGRRMRKMSAHWSAS